MRKTPRSLPSPFRRRLLKECSSSPSLCVCPDVCTPEIGAVASEKSTGQQKPKRDIFLVDEGGSSIAVTLWGSKAEAIPEDQLQQKPVVLVKSKQTRRGLKKRTQERCRKRRRNRRLSEVTNRVCIPHIRAMHVCAGVHFVSTDNRGRGGESFSMSVSVYSRSTHDSTSHSQLCLSNSLSLPL